MRWRTVFMMQVLEPKLRFPAPMKNLGVSVYALGSRDRQIPRVN